MNMAATIFSNAIAVISSVLLWTAGYSAFAVADEPAGRALFDGKTLGDWKVVKDGFFDRSGKVSVEQQTIRLEAGGPGTAIVWRGEMPTTNYELSLEAKRISGSDFFCGITFPVGDQFCTFVAGGWGGGVTGLSNINDMAAVENETTDFINFQQDKWYRIRLRVTDERIQVWIDNKKMVDVERANKKFSIWWEQEPLRPLGIASWHTTAALRAIRLERLNDEANSPPQ